MRFAITGAFIWQQVTGPTFDSPKAKPGTPHLCTHYELNSGFRASLLGDEPISFIKLFQFACDLLVNGILKAKRPASGSFLTQAVLDTLLALNVATPAPTTPLLFYGQACHLGAERLKQANMRFRHIPYDVGAQ